MTSKHETISLLRKYVADNDADKLLSFISELIEKEMKDLATTFLTKDDKIDLIDRINNLEVVIYKQAKWLAGLMIALFSLMTALFKMT